MLPENASAIALPDSEEQIARNRARLELGVNTVWKYANAQTVKIVTELRVFANADLEKLGITVKETAQMGLGDRIAEWPAIV